MKNLFYIVCFMLLSFSGTAQTFEIYKGDTINKTDAEEKKQGRWRITGNLKPSTSCYQKDQLIEEGKYLNNRKDGFWVEYYCNGNIRNELMFYNGRPDGEAYMFHENGKVAEKGNWKNNRWIGKYQQFDSLGILIAEYNFNQQGKREGTKTIKFCDFGYIEKSGDTGCDKEIKPRVFDGQQTLYNKNKQITKDGVFKDNRFMDGKAYIYDDNGVLTRIAVYKQGIYVGDAAIE